MKFHQLAIGSRFRYQGGDYCKTSPLAASDSAGNQRMIPRSALVTPAEDGAPRGGQALRQGALPAALQQHHERCRDLVEQAAAQLPEIRRLELLKALEDSYRQLLQSLGDQPD